MILAAGLLIALTAVLLVLEPLFRAAAGKPVELPVPLFADSDDEDDPVLRRRDTALAALREIEFDRATAKLSEADYERLHARYQTEALEALRAVDAAKVAVSPSAGAAAGDAVEQLIAAARASARGGKRRFCAECGAVLEGSGKFCVACGAAAGAPALSR